MQKNGNFDFTCITVKNSAQRKEEEKKENTENKSSIDVKIVDPYKWAQDLNKVQF